MQLRLTLLLIPVFLFISCISGSDPLCGEWDNYDRTTVSVSLTHEKTGDDLIGIASQGGLFNPFETNMVKVGCTDTLFISNSLLIYGLWVDESDLVEDSLYKATYMIDLVGYNNTNDIDTLNFNYKITEEVCGLEVTYIEIFYNTKEIYMGPLKNYFYEVKLDK